MLFDEDRGHNPFERHCARAISRRPKRLPLRVCTYVCSCHWLPPLCTIELLSTSISGNFLIQCLTVIFSDLSEGHNGTALWLLACVQSWCGSNVLQCVVPFRLALSTKRSVIKAKSVQILLCR